jgi:hypothetical protein
MRLITQKPRLDPDNIPLDALAEGSLGLLVWLHDLHDLG